MGCSEVYTKPSDPEPGGSLLRFMKFKTRGYNGDLFSLGQIVALLAGVDEETVLQKLKEVDPRAFPDAKVNKYSSKEEQVEESKKPAQNIISGLTGTIIGVRG